LPELPEVETVRSQLDPLLRGRRFERVSIADERLVQPFDPADVERRLEGERVEGVERRGKYLIVRFESGRVLLIHLRMTGSVRHAPPGTLAEDPYQRAVVRLDDGSDVAYRDVRRFGTWILLDRDEGEAYLASRLGGEPLERTFTAASLGRRLVGRRAPVKAAILDQRTVAGLGNIYADEALWRARVHPLRPAGELTPGEVRRLHRSVRAALAHGIDRQGATLRDYATPDGGSGSMQHEFKVYGRDGEPCPRCRSTIVKTRAAGRGTWYCPRCQPSTADAAAREPRRPGPRQAASLSSRAPERSRRQSSV
jgi:formamidopyrimidine-DNA glycosylase